MSPVEQAQAALTAAQDAHGAALAKLRTARETEAEARETADATALAVAREPSSKHTKAARDAREALADATTAIAGHDVIVADAAALVASAERELAQANATEIADAREAELTSAAEELIAIEALDAQKRTHQQKLGTIMARLADRMTGGNVPTNVERVSNEIRVRAGLPAIDFMGRPMPPGSN